MTLTFRGLEERDLPQIWPSAKELEANPTWLKYNPDRIGWYLHLVVDSDLVKGGRSVICEFIAAMLMESGLDNLAVGNNAKNGAPNTFLGINWCQCDTGYHVASLPMLHKMRSDPMEALLYVVSAPDLCQHGKLQSYFNKQRWHAWEPKTIDPLEGWSPLQAVYDVWDLLI